MAKSESLREKMLIVMVNMIFWDYSYAVIKKNTIFAGKKVVHTPLKKVVRTIIMQKKRL
jgi:hypothetical protein